MEVNIAIMRTFVQIRRLMDSNALLAEKIEALETNRPIHKTFALPLNRLMGVTGKRPIQIPGHRHHFQIAKRLVSRKSR